MVAGVKLSLVRCVWIFLKGVCSLSCPAFLTLPSRVSSVCNHPSPVLVNLNPPLLLVCSRASLFQAFGVSLLLEFGTSFARELVFGFLTRLLLHVLRYSADRLDYINHMKQDCTAHTCRVKPRVFPCLWQLICKANPVHI